LPLLGRESAIALTELGGPLPRGQLLLRHDDPAVGSDVMARLDDRLEAGGARVERRDVRGAELMVVTVSPLGSFALTTIDEVTILAMSSEDVVAAIEAHESGRSLARTDAYRAALDLAGERGGSEIFIDVGGLVSALGLADGLSADARDILARIGALGVTMPSRSDRIEIHGGLTVE
jgi:hypothetical protein